MKRLASLALLLLAGCGSVPKAASSTTPAVPPATALLIVGNSITRHGADPTIGWTGDWGMAASAEANDFAHLTAASLNLPLTTLNGAPAEQQPALNGAALVTKITAAMTPHTLVVVEMGDDVTATSLSAFGPVYDQVIEAASTGRALVCTSTYWTNKAVDTVLQSTCTAHSGIFIPIGDIYTNPDNPDYQGAPEFSNRSVQRHPHDWSMSQIAARIVASTSADAH